MTEKAAPPVVQENPNAPPTAPRESMAGAVLVGEAAPPAAWPELEPAVPEPELELEPAATLENPHAAPAAPRESMAGAVLTFESGQAVREGEHTVLEENPHEPPPPPRASMAGAVTFENDASASAPEPETLGATVERPVRELPRRPRLRATFHFDNSDRLNVELTLMDSRRELVHRVNLQPQAGGTIARIFDALLGVVTQAAAHAGVFGPPVRKRDQESDE